MHGFQSEVFCCRFKYIVLQSGPEADIEGKRTGQDNGPEELKFQKRGLMPTIKTTQQSIGYQGGPTREQFLV